MNIVILGTRGLPPRYGGRETATEEIGRRLVAMGHDVTVYGRGSGILRKEHAHYGIHVLDLPALPGKGLDSMSHLWLSTMDLIRRRRPAVVVLSDVGTSVVIPWLRHAGYATVWWVDGPAWQRSKWGWLGRKYLRFSASLGIRWADEVVIDSRASARHYEDHFGRSGEYIPYGASIEEVDDQTVLDELHLVPDGYVLFVGRLTPEKGVHHLVEAFERTDKKMPLVIVGDNPYDRNYVRSLQHAAGPSVHFAGYRFGREFAQLMKNCAVYVQPSEVEGTSPVLLTAMGYGKPVIVQGIPENLETIGDAGLSFEPGDVGELTCLISRLVGDPRERAILGKQARLRVEALYDWDHIAQQFQAVCERAWTVRTVS